MAAKLSKQQREYMQLRIKGVDGSDAYKQCYNTKANINTISKEARKLDTHPLIAPNIEKARKEAAERVLVDTETVVKGLLREANDIGEGTTQSARVAAWKALSEFTGGFDANKQKHEVVQVTHEDWLDSLK